VSALGIIVISPSGPRRVFSTPGLAISAARAGATGILDLEFVSDGTEIRNAFEKLRSSAKKGRIGVRCRSGHLPAASTFGNVAASSSVMVITAGLDSFDLKKLKQDIATAKSAGFEVIVETVSVKEALEAEKAGAHAIIAKGHESGGRVGDTTTFVLVQQCARQLKIPVWAQGGIGLHTAAAVAAAGAAGIVLDSQLYLCRDSLIPADVQLRFERLDGSETSLIQFTDGGSRYRLLAANASTRLQELEQSSKARAAEILQDNVSATSDDEVWIVGQDSCFAKTLATVGGTVSGCIEVIRQTVAAHIETVSKLKVLEENSDLAESHGTRYPIVQGAMTRVSDTSEFAFKVAEGGGLPFLALSMMRGPEIEKLINETKARLGNLPWGVGTLGFVPQQLRQEQMDVVNRHKPPFALIAGGRPDQAKALEDAGTKTYLHVPSPLLLKSFIEMGSRRFIFEGKECGGHVGPRSSFVLWEQMIDVLLNSVGPKEKPATFHVLFAGGIHDDLSAAMVATMAAPLAARGIKIGMLVGTAYLFTEEAVSAGAIVSKFQDAALKCDDTVLLETGPGHSIRCIDSPYKEIFDRCRNDLQTQNKSRDEVREELELMNLGRLRIASKGTTRGKGSDLETLPVEKQWQEGMYMIGQVAAMHDKVLTIPELHRNIATDGQQLLSELAKRDFNVAVNREGEREGIAIVGMSCMFPQANDVETFWQNVLNKVDSIEEVPATHFNWKNYYDKDPLARDKCVSKWGGFIADVVFDPTPYGIPPSSLDAIDPMQVLILEAARSALFDAGYNQRKFAREKTSVILANAGHGPITALYSLRSMLGWKLDGLDDEAVEEIKSRLPEWTEDSFAGYLGNVTAGRVANRLDLKGLNFSIDAACASSLAALYVGISDLRAGTSDVVLLGAADTHNQPGDFMSFSKTHALSPRGKCHTFDADADGIAISEGMAMVVLKRLSDAERDGDRIYAVIRGIGGSSDGRDLSLTAPRPAGQMLALERAYEDAGISPSTVGLVEAHGTGTIAGDKAEVEALTKIFQKFGAAPESCAIGSVKTNIGHTKAAAGLASIVKIAKSLYHKMLPPSINVKNPSPACKFGEGPFFLNTESRPWLHSDTSAPRRAGVSAFGFGGTNFHTILEEYVPACAVNEPPTLQAWPAELLVWKSASQEDLLKALKQAELAVEKLLSEEKVETVATSNSSRRLFELASKLQLKFHESSTAKCALSIVASSLTDLKSKIDRVRQMLDKPEAKNFSLPIGIHYSAGSLESGKVAFLFPGQGSQRIDMLKDLSMYLPELRKSIDESDEILKEKMGLSVARAIYPSSSLSESIKTAQAEQLTNTQIAQPALGACDLAMYRVLQSFGLKPDMVAGHSYGEYVALHAAGVFSVEQLLNLSAERGRILNECASNNPGAMAAVSSDVDTIASVIENVPNVYLANVNTPNQCIISGATEAVTQAVELFKKQNIACKVIPVSAAFHSPLLKASQAPLEKALNQYKYSAPSVAVYSNTTAKPYENNADRIVSQLAEHALKPVLFAKQLEAMHDSGARIFVEVGPGSVLTGLADSTLQGKEFIAVSTERAKNSLEHFLSTIGLLAAHGAIKDIGKLFWNRMPGLQGNTYELAVARKRGSLLYRVNSVGIERVDKAAKNLQANASADKNQKSQIQNVKPQKLSMETGRTMAHNVRNASENGKDEINKNDIVLDTSPLTNAQNNGSNGRPAYAGGAVPSNGQHTTGGASPVQQQRAAYQNDNRNLPNQVSVNPPAQYPVQYQPQYNNMQQGAQPNFGNVRPDGTLERVMSEFQRSMLEMTNRFLETQENVMMAYLQGGQSVNRGQQGQQFVQQQFGQTQQFAPQQFAGQNQPQHFGGHNPQYAPQQAPQFAAQQAAPQYAPQQFNGQQNSQQFAPQQFAQPVSQEQFAPANQTTSFNQLGAQFVPADQLTGGNGQLGSNGHGNNGYSTTNGSHDVLADLEVASNGNGSNGNGNGNGHYRQEVEAVTSNGSAPAAASAGLDTEALVDSLYEIVSDRTGYPREMLDPTLDLEADLGIDSIKRVEILNNFRKLLPETTQEKLESGIEKLAGTKTLQGIIEWIESLNDSIEDGASASDSVSVGAPLETGDYNNIVRGAVTTKKLDAVVKATVELAPAMLLVSETVEQGQKLKKLLTDAGLNAANLLVTDASEAKVTRAVDELRQKHGSIGSVLYMSGSPVSAGSALPVAGLFQIIKDVESDLRESAEGGKRAAVVLTTVLGGAFGASGLNSDLPAESLVQQAGIVGLSKTVAKEYPEVHVKAIDFESKVSPEQFAKAVVAELTAQDDIVEIGIRGNERYGMDVVEYSYDADAVPDALAASNASRVSEISGLTSSSVVLVTGGARGITAEIALDLARRHQPNFIIVGRLPRPTEIESPTTAGLESAKDLKAAIINELQASGKIINVRNVEKIYQQLLREREVRETLTKMQAAGSTVRYYSCDVTDDAAFSRLIDSIYETSNIDGVIHGAGIIEDALIKDKMLESFERVFKTKVDSALTLSRSIRFDTLKFMYFFSSVVGRTGNSGQADYVSANEALNKLAIRINSTTDARVAALLWGPWQAGMAPPELEEVFASHGWSMIQPQDGRVCFYEEMTCGRPEVEVMLVGKLKDKNRPEQLKSPSAESSASAVESTVTLLAPVNEAAQTTQLQSSSESESLLLNLAASAQISPSGVFLNKAQLKSTKPLRFTYMTDSAQHHYLHDHKFDGIPVMPMAVALEMMLEAARSVFPNQHLIRVSNLDIPAGIVFHTDKKEFAVEAKPDRNGQIDLQLSSLGAAGKAHFRCKAQFASSPLLLPDEWVTATASRIPRTIGQCSQLPCEANVPQPQDVYGKWLFHGPIFQGMESVLFLADDGIAGEVRGAHPSICTSTVDSSQWIVDPVLLDSAMQLAGIWARFYRDVTVLPTGFKTMHLFGPMPLKGTAQIRLNPAMTTELLCDLAIYDEKGALAFVVEGLGGIASKAFNRFSSSQEPAAKQLVKKSSLN